MSRHRIAKARGPLEHKGPALPYGRQHGAQRGLGKGPASGAGATVTRAPHKAPRQT